MKAYLSPLAKLRVFAPQMLGFAITLALADVAALTATVHAVISGTLTAAAAAFGLLTCVTAWGKALGISDDGWGQHLPPERAATCKQCVRLEKDNAELRHALAVLGPLSEERK